MQAGFVLTGVKQQQLVPEMQWCHLSHRRLWGLGGCAVTTRKSAPEKTQAALIAIPHLTKLDETIDTMMQVLAKKLVPLNMSERMIPLFNSTGAARLHHKAAQYGGLNPFLAH